mgnify:CR=1 FL=1
MAGSPGGPMREGAPGSGEGPVTAITSASAPFGTFVSFLVGPPEISCLPRSARERTERPRGDANERSSPCLKSWPVFPSTAIALPGAFRTYGLTGPTRPAAWMPSVSPVAFTVPEPVIERSPFASIPSEAVLVVFTVPGPEMERSPEDLIASASAVTLSSSELFELVMFSSAF